MVRIIKDMFDRPLNNDIDNVKKRLNNNVNDNVATRTSKEVDGIADRIMEKLSTTENRAFYCKVGWKLSDAQIFSNVEVALSGNNPQKYFTWLCKRQMD
jgi:hypothetical protein